MMNDEVLRYFHVRRSLFPVRLASAGRACSLFKTALWYNGSTSDSGSECQGSNPCRATGEYRTGNIE